MSLIKCRECGQIVSDKARSCPQCGAPIEKTIMCSECGQYVPVSYTHCPQCGAPIENINHVSPPSKTEIYWWESGKNILSIIGAIVVILFIIAMIWGFFEGMLEI